MHTVSAVMTSPVVTVAPETTFKDAVRLLRRKRVSGLPVVDSYGQLIGIVTEADLLNKVEGRDPESYLLESKRHRADRAHAAALDVASAMTRDVVSVQPDFPIALAAREMHTRGIKRLPVVDERGKVVGIVSRGDLLTVFLRSDRDVRADVKRVLEEAAGRHGGLGLKARVASGVVDLSGSFEEKSRCDALVRTVTAVEGVIGVRSTMTYQIDDTVLQTIP
ncbi:MAG TPA: CBS domain-containing protein [Candidatus Dormibacteraeota bacterium]|nr:CBS domain-containing protein [Candidatus Dormibacteraeota bacterium]